jgi:DNA polymerase III subunit delta
MQLKPEQLEASLQKKLSPVYFLTGDEPLQLAEMADAVRTAARKAGYLSREVLTEDSPDFSWNQIIELGSTLSIFADKQVPDVRLPSGKPGTEGAKVLTAYCGRPPEDSLLLITAGKIGKDAYKSRWFQALDKTGIIAQAWPLEGKTLLAWLQQRLLRRGLQADQEGIKALASRIEGNLLAAAQEIEKLYVLYGAGPLSQRQIVDAVTDNSRYNVFKLMDACLAADVGRILKILSALHHEGIAAPIVLWALSREARMLYKIKWALKQKQNPDSIFKTIKWPKNANRSLTMPSNA